MIGFVPNSLSKDLSLFVISAGKLSLPADNRTFQNIVQDYVNVYIGKHA